MLELHARKECDPFFFGIYVAPLANYCSCRGGAKDAVGSRIIFRTEILPERLLPSLALSLALREASAFDPQGGCASILLLPMSSGKPRVRVLRSVLEARMVRYLDTY